MLAQIEARSVNGLKRIHEYWSHFIWLLEVKLVPCYCHNSSRKNISSIWLRLKLVPLNKNILFSLWKINVFITLWDFHFYVLCFLVLLVTIVFVKYRTTIGQHDGLNETQSFFFLGLFHLYSNPSYIFDWLMIIFVLVYKHNFSLMKGKWMNKVRFNFAATISNNYRGFL